MAKLTLTDLANLTDETTAVAAINNNNSAIETALENTLSRDGSTPNTMGADLDMNSNQILNLTDATTDQEPVTLSQLNTAVAVSVMPSGTAEAPGLAFTADTDTGLYRIGEDILGIGVGSSGKIAVSTSAIYPVTDDGLALGITNTNEWSDLFLASGAVINWDNGDGTITHSSNVLAIEGVEIGIGTSTIKSTLTIIGNQTNGLISVANNQTDSNTKWGMYSLLHYTNSEEPFALVGGNSDGSNNNVYIGGALGEYNAATTIRLYTAANDTTVSGTLRSTLNSSGNWRWHNYGSGTITSDADGNLTSASDILLKKDIEDFDAGLETILKIQPIEFGWTKESGLDTVHRYVGFSAQNVERVLPEAVGVNGDGHKTLNDRGLMAALVNATKELETRMSKLEKVN